MIPPFHEENYEHDEMAPSSVSRDSDYHFSSARAIPSKSGLGSLVYEDALLGKEAESAAEATSRQSKKAPLPHHYEPSTIAGITIGAFLLIFIGTGKIPTLLCNKNHQRHLLFIAHTQAFLLNALRVIS